MYADENRLVMDKDLEDRLDRIEKSPDEIKVLILSIQKEDYLLSGFINVGANILSDKIKKR